MHLDVDSFLIGSVNATRATDMLSTDMPSAMPRCLLMVHTVGDAEMPINSACRRRCQDAY